MSTRRDFFRSASAGLPASWVAFASALSAAGPKSGESVWQTVKKQFPLADNLIYLNAANVGPAARPVTDRYLELLRDFESNPCYQNREKYVPMREAMRAKIAAMLRVSADEIAITRNTSEASNMIVTGLDLKPGDEIVVTDHNHPSNDHAWRVRAKREGLVVKSVHVPVLPRSKDELITACEKAITPRTRVMAITHVTSTTGVMFPAREIAELAGRRGIFVHLDGAQSFGALDVNLQHIRCDSYAASSHKWLMGPLESGILFVRSEHIPRIWPSIVTAGWTDELKGARKFEVFGQRDDPRIAAFGAAIDFLQTIGIEAVETRMRALAIRTKTKLAEIGGVTLRTNLEPELSAGVVKFQIKRTPMEEAYKQLWEKHRIAVSPSAYGDAGGLRISAHIYNSLDEIDRVVAVVKQMAG